MPSLVQINAFVSLKGKPSLLRFKLSSRRCLWIIFLIDPKTISVPEDNKTDYRNKTDYAQVMEKADFLVTFQLPIGPSKVTG